MIRSHAEMKTLTNYFSIGTRMFGCAIYQSQDGNEDSVRVKLNALPSTDKSTCTRLPIRREIKRVKDDATATGESEDLRRPQDLDAAVVPVGDIRGGGGPELAEIAAG